MIMCREIICRHIIFTHRFSVTVVVKLYTSFPVAMSCVAWLLNRTGLKTDAGLGSLSFVDTLFSPTAYGVVGAVKLDTSFSVAISCVAWVYNSEACYYCSRRERYNKKGYFRTEIDAVQNHA